jgi:hypothetical protein
MVRIAPIPDLFKICAPKKAKNDAPLLRRQSPGGTGRIAMPRHYLYRGHTQVQVLRHYRNRGMPERRGRRLAGAPRSGNEKCCFRVIELLVDGT